MTENSTLPRIYVRGLFRDLVAIWVGERADLMRSPHRGEPKVVTFEGGPLDGTQARFDLPPDYFEGPMRWMYSFVFEYDITKPMVYVWRQGL